MNATESDGNETEEVEGEELSISSLKMESQQEIANNKRRYYKIDLTKNLQCVCGRTYSKLGSLKHHMRQDCGKEPRYTCEHCPYKANRTNHMHDHVKRHHPHLI